MQIKKMRIIKCGWKIANDNMRTIKSLWGEMNLRCFLTVSNVNKPSYLIKFRPVTLAQVVELGQWTLQSDDFLNKFRSNCYRTGTGCFLKSVFTAFAPRFALIQISCNQNLKRKKKMNLDMKALKIALHLHSREPCQSPLEFSQAKLNEN